MHMYVYIGIHVYVRSVYESCLEPGIIRNFRRRPPVSGCGKCATELAAGLGCQSLPGSSDMVLVLVCVDLQSTQKKV